ncbi:MAG TPA: lipid II flippase MurJ [Solirubrobacterales bacterium]|nr:lipid II flippase MurJ [Solirubrobacterales bacterium]
MSEESDKKKRAAAGLVMAAATFSMAAASGVQAALYLHSFGIDGRTDGFFVAFALYTVFGVFSQSIRVTSAPLLVDEKRSLPLREFAATLVLIAIPVALLTIPLASPLSFILAPGLSEADRAVTQEALPILGGAMILQLWAAGGATVLAVRDRFNTIAGAYIAGAGAGLVVYLAVSASAGELSLGYSMLAMAVVTCSLMLLGLRRSPAATTSPAPAGPLRLRRLLADAGLILGRTSIYLAFNALYLITLSLTTSFSPGDATVLSYAYLFASYLVAGTAFALGMSRIADMSREARSDPRRAFGDTVPQGFRYSMLICAPALAGFVAAGAPIVGVLFSASLEPDDVRILQEFGALLSIWTVAALLVNLMLPAMFALGRARLTNLLAPALLAVHFAVSLAGGELFGSLGVVGAAFVAPSLFAAVMLRTGAPEIAGHLGREVSRDALRFVVAAAACYGLGATLGAAVGSTLGAALIAGLVGTVLYLVLLPFVAPTQVELFRRLLRPLLKARRTGPQAAT